MSRHRSIVGLRELARVEPRAQPLVWWGTDKALWLMQRVYGGVRVELEDPPTFTEPVLFAMNHSHYFDFMPSRRALWDQLGVRTVTFVKARAYQNRLEKPYLKRIGNIPLISRGYVISADFACVHGRKPREDEYRRLREHVDHGAPLPDTPLLQALLAGKREFLDFEFDSRTSSYREAIHACYAEGMAMSIEHARRVLDAGYSLHIYPQGVYSTRLSQGRIGTVQFARALNVPIMPIGFSGMNEHFAHAQMVPRKRGTLTMRFGEPRWIRGPQFEGFVPFDAQEEARMRPALEHETQVLMEEINGLLDPPYQFAGDVDGDGLEGVSRFFD